MSAKRDIKGLSIVIPSYNEGNCLERTIESIIGVLSQINIDYEIVVIDDGSTDNTQDIVGRFSQCKLVCHPINLGYGRSIKDGINASKHETIIITDADETYPAKDIPRFLEKYSKGFDMVVGSRTGPHYIQSRIKAALRHILKFMVEWASSKKIPDINSGFRIFNKTVIKKFIFIFVILSASPLHLRWPI